MSSSSKPRTERVGGAPASSVPPQRARERNVYRTGLASDRLSGSRFKVIQHAVAPGACCVLTYRRGICISRRYLWCNSRGTDINTPSDIASVVRYPINPPITRAPTSTPTHAPTTPSDFGAFAPQEARLKALDGRSRNIVRTLSEGSKVNDSSASSSLPRDHAARRA